jgi:hypothetical protein
MIVPSAKTSNPVVFLGKSERTAARSEAGPVMKLTQITRDGK